MMRQATAAIIRYLARWRQRFLMARFRFIIAWVLVIVAATTVTLILHRNTTGVSYTEQDIRQGTASGVDATGRARQLVQDYLSEEQSIGRRVEEREVRVASLDGLKEVGTFHIAWDGARSPRNLTVNRTSSVAGDALIIELEFDSFRNETRAPNLDRSIEGGAVPDRHHENLGSSCARIAIDAPDGTSSTRIEDCAEQWATGRHGTRAYHHFTTIGRLSPDGLRTDGMRVSVSSELGPHPGSGYGPTNYPSCARGDRYTQLLAPPVEANRSVVNPVLHLPANPCRGNVNLMDTQRRRLGVELAGLSPLTAASVNAAGSFRDVDDAASWSDTLRIELRDCSLWGGIACPAPPECPSPAS